MGPLAGAGAFFQGMGFVVSTPRIWWRAIVPMMTALLLFAGLVTLGLLAATAVTHGVLVFLLAVPVVILSLLLALALAQPLSGWALDGIVREQRQDLGLPRLARPAEGAMLSSLGAALLATAIGLPVLALLTLVGWFVPPAMFVTVPLKVLVGALMIAWDLVDYPLALHGVRLGDRMRWAGRNLFAVLGFGLSATLFFAVPGLGLLALPCGVAGATRMISRPGT
jgi:CysZ protein